jgi:hypothetical protein
MLFIGNLRRVLHSIKVSLILTAKRGAAMSNRNHKADLSASRQGALFDITMPEGTFDIALGFRQTLSRSMHHSGKDRYQIAAEVSRLM